MGNTIAMGVRLATSDVKPLTEKELSDVFGGITPVKNKPTVIVVSDDHGNSKKYND